MTYRIDSHLDTQNHIRCHAAERHYIQNLASRDGLIRIDNIAVDAELLVDRTFQCDSRYCLRCSGEGGARRYKGCCCTDLEVDLTAHEMEQLQNLGEMAGNQLQLAPRDPLNDVIRRLREAIFTETTEKGDTALSHLRSGRCPLSWMDRAGTFLCGINALCHALDLPLTQYKPDPCYLFPLHYVEYTPGEYLLTMISAESYEAIGADAYVTKLRCLRKPQPGALPAYCSLKHEITLCLGEEFYGRLADEARLRQEGAGADAAGEEAGS